MTDAKNKQIFLHLSPHRSGGKYIRDYILAKIPGVCPMEPRDPDCNFMVLDAMDEHRMFADMKGLRERLFERFEKVEEDSIIISHQDLFGDYLKGVPGGYYIAKPFHDHWQNTEYLAQIFDRPKVILTTRRQDTWIESAYMHFIHAFYTLTIDEFLTPNLSGGKFSARSTKPCCNYRQLDWNVYVENYYRVFGRENVLVLPFELLISDEPQFLERLYAFMGVQPYFPEKTVYANRSFSNTAYKLAMIFNRFVHTQANPLGFLPVHPFVTQINKRRKVKDTRLLWFLGGISRRISLYWFLNDVVSRFNYKRPKILSPEKRQEILEYYKEPNKKYADLIGFDLSQYGYY